MAGKAGRSGRKSKDENTRVIHKTLTEAGRLAIALLKDYVRGKDAHGNKVSITAVKMRAIEIAIAHAIGLPRQKVEMHHTGEQMSLKDLAMLAQNADTLLQKELQSGESLLQNADKTTDETDAEVVNVPTKPLKETTKMSKNLD